MKRKCSICDNIMHKTFPYRESYICEDCLDYICGLDIVHDDLNR